MGSGRDGLVCVLLPCYQAASFVGRALDSLVRQTYSDIEILALDDGSTDGSGRVLEEYAASDERVRILSSPTNLGLVATLNRGTQEARGEFVCRMDADDVARPERVERGVSFLREHPEVGLVGSGAAVIDAAGRRSGRLPARCRSPEAVRFMTMFATPVLHPTVLARTEVMRSHPYATRPEALHTEDYELFARLARSGVRMANLPEDLLAYRRHDGSVSHRFETIQVENFVTCARHHLEESLGEAVPHGPHRVLVNRIGENLCPSDLLEGLRLLGRLESAHVAESPDAGDEIRTLAAQQRADILIQAFLKGSPAMRRSAVTRGSRYLPSLLNPRVRRYLASKLRRSARTR